MHHVLITYCTLKSIYFAGIAFICDEGAIKRLNICSVCQEGLNPHSLRYSVGGGEWGGVVPMSDVNF